MQGCVSCTGNGRRGGWLGLGLGLGWRGSEEAAEGSVCDVGAGCGGLVGWGCSLQAGMDGAGIRIQTSMGAGGGNSSPTQLPAVSKE